MKTKGFAYVRESCVNFLREGDDELDCSTRTIMERAHQIFGITSAPFGIKYPLYTSSSIARCGTASGRLGSPSHHPPLALKTYQEAMVKSATAENNVDETTHDYCMPPKDLRDERVYVW